MGLNRFASSVCVVFLVCVGAAAPAVAQEEQPLRPFRQIFRAERPAASEAQTFDLTLGFAEAYDDNLFDRLVGQADPRLSEAGLYSVGSADLEYARRARRTTVAINSTNSVEFYPQFDRRIDHRHGLDGSLVFNVGARTRLEAGYTATFAPFYHLLGLADTIGERALPPPAGSTLLATNAQDFGVSALSGWDHRVRLGAVQNLGRRATIEGRFGWVRGDFGLHETRYREIGGTYRHPVGRATVLRAGYGYQKGVIGLGAGDMVFHTIDLGLDFERALTRTGSTVLAFSTGTAMIEQPSSFDYRILVDAGLTRLFNRSWSGRVGYHRGLDYLGGLGYMLASNNIDTTLHGYLSTASEVTIAGTYSTGHLYTGPSETLTTYRGSAQYRYALSRHMALDFSYFYYTYRLGTGLIVTPQIAPEVRRQAGTVGLTFWLPVGR